VAPFPPCRSSLSALIRFFFNFNAEGINHG
jgi:hypothetical protein